MAQQLARPMPRPSQRKTRVLLLRQPIKSVGGGDDRDRLGIRLAIGVIVGVGVLAVVWLMGLLGFRLGFARLVYAPQLENDAVNGLITGVMMIISIPRTILEMGLARPEWMMVAFGLIAIPGAWLSVARPLTPGAARPSVLVIASGIAGAVVAGLNTLAAMWWTTSPLRNSMLNTLPLDPADASAWMADLHTVAGLDVLIVVAAALWVVLAMRLPVPLWLKAIVTSATFFALVVTTVAMSISNASVTHFNARRSVCLLDDDVQPWRLIVGHTPQHTATMVIESDGVLVELIDTPPAMTVVESISIYEVLERGSVEPPAPEPTDEPIAPTDDSSGSLQPQPVDA